MSPCHMGQLVKLAKLMVGTSLFGVTQVHSDYGLVT